MLIHLIISILLSNNVKKQPHNQYEIKKICGADRDRTCDPRVANAMLSQLSYSPSIKKRFEISSNLVGLGRFELPTPALSERCSNRLSYKPLKG